MAKRRRRRIEPGHSRILRLTLAMGLAVGVAAAPAAAAAAPPGVVPASADLTLVPGESTTLTKTVTTARVLPKPDIVLMADTTGSMGGAISDVRADATEIIADVSAAQPSARFAVAEYKDARDPIPFRVNQDMTTDPALVQAGIAGWIALGGGDTPEGQVNALYELATGAVAFRPGGSRIVAMFGDAPAHDPSGGHTLQDTIAALQAAGIRMIIVDVDAMDLSGQATALVEATGGVLLTDVPADQVSEAILAGIGAIEVDVAPKVGPCDDEIVINNTPASRTVVSGETTTFTETIGAAPDAAAGVYTCSVDYLVGGVSAGYVQNVTVRVPGLSVDDVTVTEPDEGTVDATFTLTLTNPGDAAGPPVTVDYATADGTATAPDDYQATTGTATIPAGETTATVTVAVAADTVDDPTETFTLTLTDPSGAVLVDPTGEATIVTVPGLSIDDITVDEPETGTVDATFTLTLSFPETAPVSAVYTTEDGTATAPEDYAATTGTVTFAPGETTKTVTVPVAADTVEDPTEDFTLTLTEPSGATLTDPVGVGTIVAVPVAPTTVPTTPAPTPTPEAGPRLADTGVSIGWAALVGFLLLLLGGAGWYFTRTRSS